jgi:hypothetical protein
MKRRVRKIDLWFLIFILALLGALAARKPLSAEMVELYPLHYNLANPNLVAARLRESGFTCKLLTNRVIVNREDLAFALANIAKHDYAILTDT